MPELGEEISLLLLGLNIRTADHDIVDIELSIAHVKRRSTK